MTNDQIWTLVTDWFAARLPALTVIRQYEDGPRPTLPYVAVNFTGAASTHFHEQANAVWDATTGEDAPEGEGKAFETVDRETEWRFSVHAYGANPSDLLKPIGGAIKVADIVEPFEKVGLSVHEVSQIRVIPEYVKNVWEPRANLDFILRGVISDVFEVYPIDVIPITISREGS